MLLSNAALQICPMRALKVFLTVSMRARQSLASRSSGVTDGIFKTVYCCEKAFNTQLFLSDVEKIFQEKNNSILVALSEGIHDNNGKYISETTSKTYFDEFGHKQNAGAAQILEQIVKKEFGCKTRSIEILFSGFFSIFGR